MPFAYYHLLYCFGFAVLFFIPVWMVSYLLSFFWDAIDPVYLGLTKGGGLGFLVGTRMYWKDCSAGKIILDDAEMAAMITTVVCVGLGITGLLGGLLFEVRDKVLYAEPSYTTRVNMDKVYILQQIKDLQMKLEATTNKLEKTQEERNLCVSAEQYLRDLDKPEGRTSDSEIEEAIKSAKGDITLYCKLEKQL